jgi:hypothetical protein
MAPSAGSGIHNGHPDYLSVSYEKIFIVSSYFACILSQLISLNMFEVFFACKIRYNYTPAESRRVGDQIDPTKASTNQQATSFLDFRALGFRTFRALPTSLATRPSAVLVLFRRTQY